MNRAGFTLIEIMITIGLFAMLIGMGLFLSMDVWRGTSIQNEQDVVIALLYKARSRALANVNESAHGFYIDTADPDNRKYWVFEGDSYSTATEKQDFEMGSTVAFSGDPEIIFEPRTAMTENSDGYTFTMTGQGRERTYTINSEGGITWENE